MQPLPSNPNVEKFLRFLKNNAELVGGLYQKHFQHYGEARTPLLQVPPNSILQFIKQLFGFNRQEFADHQIKDKLNVSLKESLDLFIIRSGQNVLLQFDVITQLLRFCIQTNKAFTVEYKPGDRRPQEHNIQKQQQEEQQQQQQVVTEPVHTSPEEADALENAQVQKEEQPQSTQQPIRSQTQHNALQEQQQKQRPKSPPSSIVKNSNASALEPLKRRLKVVFEFYCKQQQNVGAYATFERISHECSVMNLGKFLMFCHNYGVTSDTLNKYVLMEKYKKVSEGMKQIQIQKFFALINSLIEIEPGLVERVDLDSDKKFKEKLKMLNIPFATKDKAIVSHIPISATAIPHKPTSHSGKTSEDLIQYLNQKKRLRKEEPRHIATPIPALPIARIFKKNTLSRSLQKQTPDFHNISTNVGSKDTYKPIDRESGSISNRESITQRNGSKKKITRYDHKGSIVPEDPVAPESQIQYLSTKNMNTNINSSYTNLKNLGLDKLIIMEEEDEEWLKQYRINNGTSGSQHKLGATGLNSSSVAKSLGLGPSRNESMLIDLRKRVAEMAENENVKERSQQAKLQQLGELQKKKLETIRRR